ncbi:MAG: Sigma 54 interacting domain protein [Candidatus Magnetoglobus multicellularis str. Araruama]|uniref:Sigma 54 interacting domain protein n=1 Tax=Candidatus Magnetoglobus multicellularis str. Araruama TaxID=890399 RepID=A0A1V1P8L8_9BACT|nr:MAG: Sigma 54 interacting domain protein [Candidatus Magnetoglobus multicellularis str. Araruama]
MAANRISEYMYILIKTAKLTFILMLIIFASISLFNMNMYQYQALLAYYWSILYAGLFKKGLMMHDDVFACAIYTKSIIQENLFISVIMGLLGLPLFLYLYMPYKKYKYLRGAKFTNRFKLKFKRGKLNCGLCKIPENQECRHFFIVGKPGTGKTVFMLEVLNQLTRHQAKCMIYDFKGDYISRFYDEGTDMIFNPIDERSVYWNFFDDIETELDIETIASILIPQNRKEIWNDAAREVLTGIIYYLWEQNRRTISDLWQCLIAENATIASILQKTERGKRGYKYIQEVDSKQTIGVIATLTQFTKCFEIIRKPKGQPFTIKDWVNKGTGNLYVSNYSNSQAILKPVLTLFIDMLTKKLLDVQASKQKTYILLDELGTLNRLEGVKRLLTLGRSYKCACFLGIQDIAQIDNVYGSDNRKTMLNSCGNWLIFGVSDYDTAKVCSNRIGEIEYYEIEKSYQIGKKGGSASRRKKREFLVLPSELQTMSDLFFIF